MSKFIIAKSAHVPHSMLAGIWSALLRSVQYLVLPRTNSNSVSARVQRENCFAVTDIRDGEQCVLIYITFRTHPVFTHVSQRYLLKLSCALTRICVTTSCSLSSIWDRFFLEITGVQAIREAPSLPLDLGWCGTFLLPGVQKAILVLCFKIEGWIFVFFKYFYILYKGTFNT